MVSLPAVAVLRRAILLICEPPLDLDTLLLVRADRATKYGGGSNIQAFRSREQIVPSISVCLLVRPLQILSGGVRGRAGTYLSRV